MTTPTIQPRARARAAKPARKTGRARAYSADAKLVAHAEPTHRTGSPKRGKNKRRKTPTPKGPVAPATETPVALQHHKEMQTYLRAHAAESLRTAAAFLTVLSQRLAR